MKKATLFMMVGLPGSGKSYFINNTASTDAVVVSRDKVRFSIISDEDEYFSKEKEVFKTFINEIQKGLDAGKTVYADATHLNAASRYKLISNLDVSNTNVIPVMMQTPLETCLKRNAGREGRACVPEDVIKNMNKSLTDPMIDCEVRGNKYYSTILYVKD